MEIRKAVMMRLLARCWQSMTVEVTDVQRCTMISSSSKQEKLRWDPRRVSLRLSSSVQVEADKGFGWHYSSASLSRLR